ncbi:BZ3500_MvSof-1268-A1-R1_Chr2-1g04444 [Microbotryum saponariae]|uniref:BZ3500_MvSof-1268-A1-R1_Chr2-1g04444 protein n=1 Tax=Microbotryum saponariae TaxID=289078 RepID=A0A2X0MHT7_9BASI|nr:BZ3500_MvSof-1268-A1-R1_Chr2-1g04444 [Microbotryum saponariae]SCZ91724.1 BZ3501_MvSof-1269-A2-R1_Chr2-1g04100 [Microbotryum saponariae]
MASILCDVTNVVSAGQSTSPSTSAAAAALKHRSSSSSSSPPVAARLASSSSATGASSITARRRGAARPPVLRQTSLDFFAPTCTPPVANSSSHPGWSSRATRVDDVNENETRSQPPPPPTQPHASSSSSPAGAAFASSPATTITSASGSSCHDDGSEQRSSPLASRYLIALRHTRDEADSSMDIDEDDAFVSSRNVLKRARSQFDGDGDEEDEEESHGAARSRHHSSRVPTPPVQVHSWSTTSNPTRMIESIYNMPQRTLSVHEMLRRRALGMNVSMQQVALRPVLLDLVSSNEHHVVRCPSSRCDRILAYPFASKFSNAAKAGGKQILAIGDEEGGLTFVDASKQSQWDTDTSRTSFQAHDNAVFDIAWSSDDRTITTASGDQTAVLWDVETMTCTARLLGHSGTIKSTQWDPKNPNLLATASRDGSIRIWDRRIDSRGEDARNNRDGSAIGCVNMIRNAHGGAKKTKEHYTLQSPKSVTAAVFLPQSDNLLASSGSADSVIKVWDLRRSHSRRINPASFETNEIAVSNTSSKRPHGISSLVLSPDGRALYSLGTDAVISSFKPGNLTHSYPLATYQHPTLVVNSFYIRLAVSPDSRFISCGSTDNAVYAWDTCAAADQGVRMVGHEKEVSCVDWSAKGGLVSCSDDGLVRLWSTDREKARRIRSNEVEDQEIGWRWCGAV